ncbi:uncharacterized protein [Muntiacus reevesi]|uniref:uncharacterized protein n=1 Tax=Muntiacus reevesi TaxID=9886 RepID=UPI003306C3F1
MGLHRFRKPQQGSGQSEAAPGPGSPSTPPPTAQCRQLLQCLPEVAHPGLIPHPTRHMPKHTLCCPTEALLLCADDDKKPPVRTAVRTQLAGPGAAARKGALRPEPLSILPLVWVFGGSTGRSLRASGRARESVSVSVWERLGRCVRLGVTAVTKELQQVEGQRGAAAGFAGQGPTPGGGELRADDGLVPSSGRVAVWVGPEPERAFQSPVGSARWGPADARNLQPACPLVCPRTRQSGAASRAQRSWEAVPRSFGALFSGRRLLFPEESAPSPPQPSFQMGLIIYVSLLLVTPKILSLLFDPQDNAFLSWSHSYAEFYSHSNCWVCGALHSSSLEVFSRWISPIQRKDFLQLCKYLQQQLHVMPPLKLMTSNNLKMD